MKVVIVGASGSLGRALAIDEAKLTSNLVLIASDLRDLEAIKSDLHLRYSTKVDVLALDLFDVEACNLIPVDGDRYYFPIGMTLDADHAAISDSGQERVFQINFFSVTKTIAKVLAVKKDKAVEFIGFGSIAQTRGRSGNTFYSAAKRALTSYFESLLHGSETLNIRPYLFQIGYMESQLSFGKKMLFPAAPSNDVAKKVLQIVTSKQPGIFYVPKFWRLVCTILLMVPWPIYRKMKF